VAYRASGQLDRAIKTAQSALNLAAQSKDSALAAQIEQRLSLWRSTR
jgi:hypothetical protein